MNRAMYVNLAMMVALMAAIVQGVVHEDFDFGSMDFEK